MNGKLVFALGGAVLLAAGIWLYLAPYVAARRMKAAADARDAVELASYVDFLAVRESLKTGVSGKVAAATAPMHDNPLVAFGAAVASTLADPMIDALVTPESLALMLAGSVPERAAAMVGVAAPDAEVETSMGYDDFSTFVLTVKRKGSSGSPIGFVMSRTGIFSWKLTGVRLP